MAPQDDELFRIFLTKGEESPFSELVRRHLGLVHSAAMRITCQPALAEDVSQLVFIKLAQVRSPLATGLSIVTWLHRTTRSTAIDVVRAESRRRKREKTAASLAMDKTSIPWDEISPILDDVINKLAEDERHAVLCRFFEGQSHADIARTLGVSQDAARMRVNRALEKVRTMLEKKGITTTASALAVALPSHVFAAPPTGLAITVATTALASLPHSLPIITIGIVTMTKKTAIAITALLIASAGTAAYLKLQPAPATAHSGTLPRKDMMDSSRAKRSDTRQTTNSPSRAERERIAKHNEMLDRLSREASAAAQKSFAASRSAPAPIISISSGGGLNPSVIESLSLSASEVKSLKTVISETSSIEAKRFAERAERQPGTGEQDGASFKYLVRAKRDRGAAGMKQLAEKVGQILDESRSKQFMGGVGEFDFYAGFGRYDVEMTFYSENGVDMVKYQYLNPSSGKPTRFGCGKLDDPNYSRWKVLGTVPDVNGGGSHAAEEGIRESKGMGKDKPSKLKEPATTDSAPPPATAIQAFGENGRLTTLAIENLNLTREEVASLTELLTTVKAQAAADFVSRTKLTEDLPGANGAFRHTYFVKARPDRGMEFSASLAKGAESLIGAARAQRINSSISSLDFFGGSGKYDLNIVVSSDGGEKVVKYEMIDPKDGSVLETQECGYKAFSDAFGDVFAY